MSALNFYDVQNNYVEYLKDVEVKSRGFTCVPNVVYGDARKFLCGIVLIVNGCNYYVPLTSSKSKYSKSILIEFPNDKLNKVKGSLRFNYMFPVPESCITERIIKDEPNAKRRQFLYAQLRFCIRNAQRITNQARRTYQVVTKKLSPSLLENSCDFIYWNKLAKHMNEETEDSSRAKAFKNPVTTTAA